MTDMYAVLWEPGTPIADLSAERVKEIQGKHTGPLVAVVIDGGVAVIQPMDPQTGEDWSSEADALAFAERYMSPAPSDEPDVTEE
jgi:hypothetical protein